MQKVHYNYSLCNRGEIGEIYFFSPVFCILKPHNKLFPLCQSFFFQKSPFQTNWSFRSQKWASSELWMHSGFLKNSSQSIEQRGHFGSKNDAWSVSALYLLQRFFKKLFHSQGGQDVHPNYLNGFFKKILNQALGSFRAQKWCVVIALYLL